MIRAAEIGKPEREVSVPAPPQYVPKPEEAPAPAEPAKTPEKEPVPA